MALLALGAALCPALAANEGAFALPGSLILWVGMLGLLFGLRMARQNLVWRLMLYAPLLLIMTGLLIIATGQALPPFSLIWSDLSSLGTLLSFWWKALPLEKPPEFLLWRFLAASLPRLWRELLAAPSAGIPGATLILSMLAVCSTWFATLYFGWALTTKRLSFIASQPLLGTIALITILNGSPGIALLIGLCLLLLLGLLTAHNNREQRWERLQIDYSDQLIWDVLLVSTLGTTLILIIAFLMPTRVPSMLASVLWPDPELPSAIAVLDQQIQRQRPQPTAEIGLSKLPSLSLGISLAQDSPEKLALRIRTNQPLTNTGWPHYWRARLLTRYDGRQWWATARVMPFGQDIPSNTSLPAGAIVQDVEDLRIYQDLLVAQPVVIGLDISANGEHLSDGTLSALTIPSPSGHYRVLSLAPELAAPLDQNQVPPPDLSAYLALPAQFSPRVRDLAQSIAGQKPDALNKAIALELYLRNLPYSYTVRPTPADRDAVDYFLFDMREGYCTYYASSMVLMARSLGIPARLAIGYATGSYDASLGGYIVREADAHAWPELLINGRWMPFEPTAVQPLPERQNPLPIPAPANKPVESSAPISINWSQLALITISILACLAALLGAWLVLQRQRLGPLAQAQQTLEHVGLQANIVWPTGATLHEYAALIERHMGTEIAPLRTLVQLIEQAHYSQQRLDSQQLTQLRQARAALLEWARRDMGK